MPDQLVEDVTAPGFQETLFAMAEQSDHALSYSREDNENLFYFLHGGLLLSLPISAHCRKYTVSAAGRRGK
jgi:hypothetical protein